MNEPLLSGPQGVLFAALAAAAFYTDWKYRHVYNWITYPALVAGLVLAAIWSAYFMQPREYWWVPLAQSVGGAVFSFVLLFLVFLQGGVAAGDVKLMTAAGAIVGFPFVIEVLMYSVLVGLAAGLSVVIWEGKFRQLLGRVFSFKKFFGKHELEDSVTLVPFGMAFGGGALWAVLIHV